MKAREHPGFRKITGRPRASVFLYLLFLASLANWACLAIPGRGGTTHYVVLGFGVISVNERGRPGVVATDGQTLGVCVSDRPGLKLAVGYSSSAVVSVADGAEDVRVEASRRVGGPLVVEAARVKLANQ